MLTCDFNGRGWRYNMMACAGGFVITVGFIALLQLLAGLAHRLSQ